jgi:hypothetical protein
MDTHEGLQRGNLLIHKLAIAIAKANGDYLCSEKIRYAWFVFCFMKMRKATYHTTNTTQQTSNTNTQIDSTVEGYDSKGNHRIRDSQVVLNDGY